MDPIAQISAETFVDLQRQTLPRGLVWDASSITEILRGLSGEWSVISAAVRAIIAESDPYTVSDRISHWLSIVGTPDECTALPDTLEKQRTLLQAQLTARGGNTIERLRQLVATLLGIDVSRVVYSKDPAFRCGMARAGQALTGQGACATFRLTIYDWDLGLPFRVGLNRTGERLHSDYRYPGLMCLINKAKAAHTFCAVGYSNEGVP